ncbi:hypothetical protein ACLMJK_002007 [Lecanora helva]
MPGIESLCRTVLPLPSDTCKSQQRPEAHKSPENGEPYQNSSEACAFEVWRKLVPKIVPMALVKPLFSEDSAYDILAVHLYVPPLQRSFLYKLPREPCSSAAAASCKEESLRATWAGENGFGPRISTFDNGNGGVSMDVVEELSLTAEMNAEMNSKRRTRVLNELLERVHVAVVEERFLSTEMLRERLSHAVTLLKKIHEAEPQNWMKKCDPVEIVDGFLQQVKERNAMPTKDIRLAEAILCDVKREFPKYPLTPCHNDVYCKMILQHPDSETLLALNWKYCNLGDAMWDLANLAVDLEMEKSPAFLERKYGANVYSSRRVRAYIPLAVALCAIRASLRGEALEKDYGKFMARFKNVIEVSL